MFGSDRNRPKDYRRAVVIDAGPKNMTNEDTFRSERRSTLKKQLTEPTLLEMSGYPTQYKRVPLLGQVLSAEVNLPERNTLMTTTQYIGMDVHKESISIAVRNAAGKVVMECVIETKASTILQFIDGLHGDVHVTFEEGTWAAWLHDLLKPHVTKLVVCDPRRNALLQEGNQNDRVDARKLAELLHNNQLRSVYHGDHGLRTLKELVRSYLTITQDLSRVMSRVKAIYRSWAIPCTGKQVYAPRHRAAWLAKINEPGVHRRAEFYYQQ